MVNFKDIVEVGPLEESEALELLRKTLDQHEESPESHQLVEELEFMPLAIVQAGSFIRERGPRYSVSRYLQEFRDNDREATKLLKKEPGYLNRDSEATNSILMTWQISFDYIRHTKRSATDLLSLMSLFDRQGIPESLIQLQPKASHTSNSEAIDCSDGETCASLSDPDFEENIATLRDYSFRAVSKDNTLFAMHRLVQLTTWAWLKSHKQIDQWREKLTSILYQEIPRDGNKNWLKWQALFPHVRSAIFQKPKAREATLIWVSVLSKDLWHAALSGNIMDARVMASILREQVVKLRGEQSMEALLISAILANICSLDHRWEEAEQLQEQIMKTNKMTLGVDHPNTLASMSDLALIYTFQYREEQAEQLFMKVIETSKKNLGVDHPNTLRSMFNLALLHKKQGRWAEAEVLLQIIETSKMKLGVDNTDTLTNMDSLASVLSAQGRWGEAEPLFMQVFETHKTKLGVYHPHTLSSMNDLAVTYADQGRWEEAEPLFRQVFETHRMKLCVDHSHTLSGMECLAETYARQSRWEEAEALFRQVIETHKMKLGVAYPSTLMSMSRLALMFLEQGRWGEAEPLFRQVFETRKMKLGVDHSHTLSSMDDLAVTYAKQGRWEEAEPLFRQVFETRRMELGVDHPHTLSSMDSLAESYTRQGRREKAESLFMQVTKTRKRLRDGSLAR